MGGFGLVLVFVGCFIVPIISFLFKWRYPPLSDEEQLQLNDAKDLKLQSLFQLIEKQAVHVSDIDWNKVSLHGRDIDPSNHNSRCCCSSRGDDDIDPSDYNKSPTLCSKKRSVKDFLCTTIHSAMLDNGNKMNNVNGKPSSSSSKSSSSTTKSKTMTKAVKQKQSSTKDNGDDDYDVEAANDEQKKCTKQGDDEIIGDNKVNICNDDQQQDQEYPPLDQIMSHASLDSHCGNTTNSHVCAICLEEYHHRHNTNDDSDDDQQQVILATGGCSHYFHKNCMKSLIRSRARKSIYEVVPCPICRLSFFAPTTWNSQVELVDLLESSGGGSGSGRNTNNNTINTTTNGAVLLGTRTTTTMSSEEEEGQGDEEAPSTENVVISVPAEPAASASLPLSSQTTASSSLEQRDNNNSRTHKSAAAAATNTKKNPKEDFSANDSFVAVNSTTGPTIATSIATTLVGEEPSKSKRKSKRKKAKTAKK
eukprot:CAMPEP_0113637458 /NCGR_PEP_ID=MMETSP0017_2-20120614/19608_1 /TAXON_ID=2856 /ORGANISM="Cylindrotheca closterium" /LENGTH=476 /DNA_ID=CAMNT_0000548489 /DNA_START=263 /DNA_END=1693 /DNA_ORIENTATION=+ /assembly_acc=CAM_ASM_000147